jgi:hypothetical protein
MNRFVTKKLKDQPSQDIFAKYFHKIKVLLIEYHFNQFFQ